MDLVDLVLVAVGLVVQMVQLIQVVIELVLVDFMEVAAVDQQVVKMEVTVDMVG
jgi:hypothetical protein